MDSGVQPAQPETLPTPEATGWSVANGEAAAGGATQDDADLECMLQSASILADENLTLYGQPWVTGCPLPPALAATQETRECSRYLAPAFLEKAHGQSW